MDFAALCRVGLGLHVYSTSAVAGSGRGRTYSILNIYTRLAQTRCDRERLPSVAPQTIVRLFPGFPPDSLIWLDLPAIRAAAVRAFFMVVRRDCGVRGPLESFF